MVTTVHSGPAEAAHGRISLLCQRRFQLGMEVSLAQARQAFPIVVFTHKCEDNTRRIMDISECSTSVDGGAEYRCLYRYHIAENKYEAGKYAINGRFEKVNEPSTHLRMLLTRSGVPSDMIQKFMKGDCV